MDENLRLVGGRVEVLVGTSDKVAIICITVTDGVENGVCFACCHQKCESYRCNVPVITLSSGP